MRNTLRRTGIAISILERAVACSGRALNLKFMDAADSRRFATPLAGGIGTRAATASAWQRVNVRAVNLRLTITSRALLKRNYNSMNQAFLAIVVKILARKFTIPTRFVDLLWRMTERVQRSFL
jgi:hypothetical protein